MIMIERVNDSIQGFCLVIIFIILMIVINLTKNK